MSSSTIFKATNRQRPQGRRRLGMAPGLRLLVLQWLRCAEDAELHDCARSHGPGKRLPKTRQRLAQARTARPCPTHGRAKRRGPKTHDANFGNARSGRLRSRPGRCRGFSWKYAAPVRSKPLRQAPLDASTVTMRSAMTRSPKTTIATTCHSTRSKTMIKATGLKLAAGDNAEYHLEALCPRGQEGIPTARDREPSLQPLPSRIGIGNRIVVAPMGQYSTWGSATDWHLMHLGQFR